ncbi:hypothetical protein Bpfe_015562 [Biomphalaria pfeifferi]|uniref:Uncharacterized protein n=1 Tax=Biomphalaria pfeifferi TaxID=112525 RepID=A0AAD8BI21_BIOPF|nr:hypothetical protein Bpfe_015562 [Biomphalaria pfeifferi]
MILNINIWSPGSSVHREDYNWSVDIQRNEWMGLDLGYSRIRVLEKKKSSAIHLLLEAALRDCLHPGQWNQFREIQDKGNGSERLLTSRKSEQVLMRLLLSWPMELVEPNIVLISKRVETSSVRLL